MNVVGQSLKIVGGIVLGAAILYGVITMFTLVHSQLGFIGIVAGFMLLPIATLIAPIYILVTYGDWLPMAMVYGGILTGAAIISFGSHIIEKYTRDSFLPVDELGKEASNAEIAISQKQNERHRGLGGWLILVGFALIFSPLVLGMNCIDSYLPIFSDGTWEIITDPNSDAYDRLWAPIILGELILNFGILIASVYLIYLFFSKSKRFPSWFIGLRVVEWLIVVLDGLAASLVLPDEQIIDGEVIRLLVVCLIWIPYMLRSKRVKATFVR